MTVVNWRIAFNDLIDPIIDTLLQDPRFMGNAFDLCEIGHDSMTPRSFLDLMLNEAARSMQMIASDLQPGMRVLEIGGGIGLTYAMLRSMGVVVVSLEPGAEGFGHRHRAGSCLMELLGIYANGWVRSGIEDYTADQEFDMVFSHFVLEHIANLESAFKVMSAVIKPGGRMIHRCPNYAIPFEPHFNIPLIPFCPQWTVLMKPSLKKNDLWNGLQFITARQVLKLCARNGFRLTFHRGMTAWAFKQLFIDHAFASRKKSLIKTAKILRKLGLIDALEYLPPVLDTPIQFTAVKAF